jgi:hypothetical protein
MYQCAFFAKIISFIELKYELDPVKKFPCLILYGTSTGSALVMFSSSESYTGFLFSGMLH